MRFWGSWWVALIVAMGPAAAGIIGVYTSDIDVDTKTRLYIVVAVVSIAAGLVQHLDGKKRRHLKDLGDLNLNKATSDALVKSKMLMNDSLNPLILEAKIAVSCYGADSAMSAQRLLSGILAAGSKVLDGDRVRVSLWAISVDESGVKIMSSFDHYGRGDQPTTKFREGTRNGNALFKELEKGEPIVCPRISENPPRGMDMNRTRGYETFINMPIFYGDELFGMISADAPAPFSFNDDEKPTIVMLASLASLAITIRENAMYQAGFKTDTDAHALQ